MLYSKDKDTIYHATLGYTDGISGFFNDAKEMADKTHQTIKFCWSGTLGTAEPGQAKKDISDNWDGQRTDYQSTKNKRHKALCPECNK